MECKKELNTQEKWKKRWIHLTRYGFMVMSNDTQNTKEVIENEKSDHKNTPIVFTQYRAH